MKIGFVYPQTEFGNDPIAIRDLAQTAEGLGYSHVLAYDHVLGVNPNRAEDWDGPYDFRSPFHSPPQSHCRPNEIVWNACRSLPGVNPSAVSSPR